MQYGGIPLYISGLAEDARRFGSLHAVQRHMIDCNKCSMLYDGNEDEYEEYYEYPCAPHTPQRLSLSLYTPLLNRSVACSVPETSCTASGP